MSSPLLRGALGSLPLARGSWGRGHALGRSTAFPRGCVGRAAPSPRAGRDAELRGAADQGRRTGPALWGGCESGPHPWTRLGTPTSWAAPGRRTGAPGGRWAWGGEPAVSLRTSAHPGAAPRSQGTARPQNVTAATRREGKRARSGSGLGAGVPLCLRGEPGWLVLGRRLVTARAGRVLSPVQSQRPVGSDPAGEGGDHAHSEAFKGL